jgi:hypothetical protein
LHSFTKPSFGPGGGTDQELLSYGYTVRYSEPKFSNTFYLTKITIFKYAATSSWSSLKEYSEDYNSSVTFAEFDHVVCRSEVFCQLLGL